LRAVLVLLLALSTSAHSQAGEPSPHSAQTMECMLKALKTVPGVSKARRGEYTKAGVTSPFLEYRAKKKSHWMEPTRFYFDKANGAFIGNFPGIGPIDTHVTDIVVDLWKSKCGVQAIVVFN